MNFMRHFLKSLILVGSDKEYVLFCKGLMKAICLVKETVFTSVPNIRIRFTQFVYYKMKEIVFELFSL